MPAVSVILPTCDRPHLWPRALASILAQSFADFEVLLVDSNRLAPLSAHPSSRLILADRRVRLIEEKHAPCSAAARNVGLRAARGDWITYLDDDDTYRPEKVFRQFERAKSSDAPMVLCGYRAVLPRRTRIRQADKVEYRGDALLTDATWCTPLLFHRRDPGVMFNESLRAGEDEVFAHAFLTSHGEMNVPNCTEPLVDMHPQVHSTRVHRNTEAVWEAYRVNWKQVRTRYSRDALRAYLAMGLLVRAQGGHGDAAGFIRRLRSVLVTRGFGSWRLAANATAQRTGVLREWIVS
jgi:glycosyltransferase involved in cell wall biosynthesis